MKIEDVEGIGEVQGAKLRGVGVNTTDELLSHGAKAAGRDLLANTTGLSAKLILEWVNHADLMRIDGVGSEYADLLEAAGVDSTAELAQRSAANLALTFQEVDAARPNMVRRVPSTETVEGWITLAKGMARVVEH
jgi:predicted flap endonuclease-1-like 5' DNA nuclease